VGEQAGSVQRVQDERFTPALVHPRGTCSGTGRRPPCARGPRALSFRGQETP
jgi:hypothetical protein